MLGPLEAAGPDGPVQVGPGGDPNRARFDRWGWNADGLDQALSIGPINQVSR